MCCKGQRTATSPLLEQGGSQGQSTQQRASPTAIHGDGGTQGQFAIKGQIDAATQIHSECGTRGQSAIQKDDGIVTHDDGGTQGHFAYIIHGEGETQESMIDNATYGGELDHGQLISQGVGSSRPESSQTLSQQQSRFSEIVRKSRTVVTRRMRSNNIVHPVRLPFMPHEDCIQYPQHLREPLMLHLVFVQGKM